MLAGFFGVIFAINVDLHHRLGAAPSAARTKQKPYLQGVEYNQTLARRAEQARLGWRATHRRQRLASGAVRVDD